MTYQNAVALLRAQNARIKKVDGVRFAEAGYEYRVTYFGGFSCYVEIDRRQVGKGNFRYFGGFDAYGCATAEEVMEKVMEEVKNGKTH